MSASIELERSWSDIEDQIVEQKGQRLLRPTVSVPPNDFERIANQEDDDVCSDGPTRIDFSTHFDDNTTSVTAFPSDLPGAQALSDYSIDRVSLDKMWDDKVGVASSPTLSLQSGSAHDDSTNCDDSIVTDHENHKIASGAVVDTITAVEEHVDSSEAVNEVQNWRHQSGPGIILPDNNESNSLLDSTSKISLQIANAAEQSSQVSSGISDSEIPGSSVLSPIDDRLTMKRGVHKFSALSEDDWPMNEALRELTKRQELDLSNDPGPDFGPSPTSPAFPGAWPVVDGDIGRHELAGYDWKKDPLLLRRFRQNEPPWRNLSTLIQFLRDGLMWLLLAFSWLVSSFGSMLHLHAIRLYNNLRWQKPILDGVLLFSLAYGLAYIGMYYRALDNHYKVIEMHRSLNFTLSSAVDGLFYHHGIEAPTLWTAQLNKVIHITDGQISNIEKLKIDGEVKVQLVSGLQLYREFVDITRECFEDLSQELQYTSPGNLVLLSNARQSLNGRGGWSDDSEMEVRQAFVMSLSEAIDATDNEILRPISTARLCKTNLDVLAEFKAHLSRTIQIARTQSRLEDSNKGFTDILLRPGASRASTIQQLLFVQSLDDFEIRAELDQALEYLSKYEEDVRSKRPALYALLAQSSIDELIGLDSHLLAFFAQVALRV